MTVYWGEEFAVTFGFSSPWGPLLSGGYYFWTGPCFLAQNVLKIAVITSRWKDIYVIYRSGEPIIKKNFAQLVFKTEGKVFLEMVLPRPVNNIFIVSPWNLFKNKGLQLTQSVRFYHWICEWRVQQNKHSKASHPLNMKRSIHFRNFYQVFSAFFCQSF